MKHFVLSLLIMAGIGSYAQKAQPAAITRFYQYTGTIDKYPVTFLLHRINNDFFGTYYYQSSGSPIVISGRMNEKGFLEMTHTSRDENHHETFEGSFRDSSFSGTWRSNAKKLAFEVSEKKDNSTLQFDYIWTYGTKKLAKKPAYMSHIEGLDYDTRAVWPTANSKHPSKQLIQQTIREMFGEKNSSDEVGKIMLRQKNNFLNTPEDSVIDYESSETVDIAYFDARLVCLSRGWSNYSGGAHGIYGTSYTNIDLQNNRRLILSDVIDTVAAKKTVEKMLEQQFRKNFPFDEGEKLSDVLLVEKITMTENFLLTGKGIVFHYDPYEIAAYVYGEIELSITYKDIDRYLKPGFKKLIAQ
jgi:hypothetical protein